MPAADEPINLHRERYAQASRLLRDLSTHSQMRQPALSRSASETLQLGKRIFAQLIADSPALDESSDPAPRPDLEAALEAYTARVAELLRQVRLMDRVFDYAEELAGILDGLTGDPDSAADALRSLARRIVCDVRGAAYGAQLLPWPGIDVQHSATAGEGGADVCCTGSVVTATVAAWSTAHYHVWTQHAELFTSAALLQDAGLFYWKRLRGISPDELRESRPEDYRNHPKVGAAFVGALRRSFAALPRIVATHHERLDRRGFPARIPPGLLTPTMRFLPVVNRFCELLAAPRPVGSPEATAADGARSIRLALEATAEALLDEAERGAWDLPLTRAVLTAFDANPPSKLWDDPAAVRQPALSEFGHRRLRRDAAHAGPPAPHVPGVASPGEARRLPLTRRSGEWVSTNRD